MTPLRALLLIVVSLSLVVPGLAENGNPQGWSVSADQRKRVSLRFVDEPDGPNVLLIACHRDTSMLGIYSAGLADGAPRNAMMSLQNRKVKYGLRGQAGVDDRTGQPVFAYQTDLDATALRYLQSELMPVLQGKGPIQITIGEIKRDVPVAGLAGPLKQFAAICFGRS